MLARFSVSAAGAGVHMSDKVADAIRLIEESGLDYQVTAMDTLVEGNADAVLSLIQRCIEAMHEHSERVICDIKIDDWSGKTSLLRDKVQSVERVIGRGVSK